VPFGASKALPTQLSAITSKRDSLHTFSKKGKRKGEELKV